MNLLLFENIIIYQLIYINMCRIFNLIEGILEILHIFALNLYQINIYVDRV